MPQTPLSKKFRVFMVLLYLGGLYFVRSLYDNFRYPQEFCYAVFDYSKTLVVLGVLGGSICCLLALGSFWFWSRALAKSLIILLLINTVAALLAIRVARVQIRTEKQAGFSEIEKLSARIDSYHQSHGHYPDSLTDLRLSEPAVYYRDGTLAPIGYQMYSSNTYVLTLSYRYDFYVYDCVTHRWLPTVD